MGPPTASALLLVLHVVNSFAGSRRRRGALGENMVQIQRPVLSWEPMRSRVLVVRPHLTWKSAGVFLRWKVEFIGGKREVGGGGGEVVE